MFSATMSSPPLNPALQAPAPNRSPAGRPADVPAASDSFGDALRRRIDNQNNGAAQPARGGDAAPAATDRSTATSSRAAETPTGNRQAQAPDDGAAKSDRSATEPPRNDAASTEPATGRDSTESDASEAGPDAAEQTQATATAAGNAAEALAGLPAAIAALLAGQAKPAGDTSAAMQTAAAGLRGHAAPPPSAHDAASALPADLSALDPAPHTALQALASPASDAAEGTPPAPANGNAPTMQELIGKLLDKAAKTPAGGRAAVAAASPAAATAPDAAAPSPDTPANALPHQAPDGIASAPWRPASQDIGAKDALPAQSAAAARDGGASTASLVAEQPATSTQPLTGQSLGADSAVAALPSSASWRQPHAPGQGTPQLPVQVPADQPEWAGEVGNQVRWMLGRAEGRAELVLNPSSLGRLEVSINLSGDQATAQFVASTQAARDALEQALPRLREHLQQAGIQLGQADVGTSAQSGGPGHDQATGRHPAHGSRASADADTLAEAPSAPVRMGPAHDSMVDTFV